MKQEGLGEFQELILLAILVLEDDAYGVSIQKEIKDKAKRKVSRGALHSALTRLQEKGLVVSKMGGATAERGGRRKRFFNLTQKGTRAVTLARISRVNFYQAIGNLDFGKA
ncbi:MAG TPA: PadR family transcriptional regulator [Cyclobacteriaceae bacterium]|jgi:DNA-binding PadR family transcriptional regulator